jgi:hypothetical protein
VIVGVAQKGGDGIDFLSGKKEEVIPSPEQPQIFYLSGEINSRIHRNSMNTSQKERHSILHGPCPIAKKGILRRSAGALRGAALGPS